MRRLARKSFQLLSRNAWRVATKPETPNALQAETGGKVPALKCTNGPSAMRRIIEGIRDWFFQRRRVAAAVPNVGVTSINLCAPGADAPPCAAACRQRLAKAAARLDDLEAERKRQREPHFDQAAEDRIVWRELIELELQELDERLARNPELSGTKPERAGKSGMLREEARHECNRS